MKISRKEWICDMSEFLFFLIGLLLGGCIGFILLCSIQINRINDYEYQIRKLKSQIANEPKGEMKNK